MYILLNNEKQVVGMVEQVIRNDKGLLTITNSRKCYYPQELDEVEVSNTPEGIKPFAYLYVDGEFVPNPNYEYYRDPMVIQKEEIANLKIELQEAKDALDFLMLNMV